MSANIDSMTLKKDETRTEINQNEKLKRRLVIELSEFCEPIASKLQALLVSRWNRVREIYCHSATVDNHKNI